MERLNNNNNILFSVKCGNVTEYHISSVLGAEENIKKATLDIVKLLDENKIKPLVGFAFGNTEQYKIVTGTFSEKGKIFPVTWTESFDNKNEKTDGIYIIGISGVNVNPVTDNEKIIGNYYEDEYATYAYLGDITSGTPDLADDLQSQLVFNKLESYLGICDLKMTDLVRTWFYNRDILAWYGDFNKVRTAFYKEHKIFENLLPSSTGIDGKNPGNGALIAGAIAIRPKNNNIVIKEVDSPLQNQATCYGSSFSRAVEIKTPEIHKVTVSGTASIDKEGKTVYIDDFDKQVVQTFNTVKEILKQCGMDFKDVCRAFAYVKFDKDLSAFYKYLKDNDLEEVPFITTNTTICRHDLLFEIEVDAVKKL